MRRAGSIVAAAVVFIATSVSSCSRSGEWKGSITVKDGVTVVSNPAEPMRPNAAAVLTEELRIGVPEGPPEYMFSQVHQIDVGPDGKIYVLESKDKQVRVFGADGKHLRTIGRPGQGPGELMSPGNPHVLPSGEIMVSEGRSRRVRVFSPEGEHLRDIDLKRYYPFVMEYGPGDVFYIMHPVREPPDFGFHLMRLDAVSGAAERLALLRMQAPGAPAILFDATLSFCAGEDGRVVVGLPEDGYEFRVFSPSGKLERIVRREWTPAPVTDAEKEAYRAYDRAHPSEIEMKFEFARNHAPYLAVTRGEDGRFLVHVSRVISRDIEAKTEATFDLFDAEGRYQAQVRFPFRSLMERLAWRYGKLYTIEPDEDGYLSIVRYSLEIRG